MIASRAFSCAASGAWGHPATVDMQIECLARQIYNQWLGGHLTRAVAWPQHDYGATSADDRSPNKYWNASLRLLCDVVAAACDSGNELEAFEFNAPAQCTYVFLKTDSFEEVGKGVSETLKDSVRSVRDMKWHMMEPSLHHIRNVAEGDVFTHDISHVDPDLPNCGQRSLALGPG